MQDKTGQSDHGSREGIGVNRLECHHATCTGQPANQTHSAWVYERQVLLDQLDFLL